MTGLLDRWAVWIAAKPGAGLYFDTAYAAIVCLVLIVLCWLAFRWRLRLRVAVPCIVLTAAVSVGLGNALSRDVVHIDLVGSANAPAVVVTQNDTAVVLFRGGNSVRNAVEEQLARRGAGKIELLVDLRTKPETPCALEAEQTRFGRRNVCEHRAKAKVYACTRGSPAHPERLPCAADHRQPAVRDPERQGGAGAAGLGTVASGIPCKAGGGAV